MRFNISGATSKLLLRVIPLVAFFITFNFALSRAAEPEQPSEQPVEIIDFFFEVKNFSDLRVQDNVNVVYTLSSDSIASVRYSATRDFDDAFIFTSSGETLKIQVNTEDLGKPGLPTLFVASNRLDKIENYSDFNLKIDSKIHADSFTASLIGNGSISIADIQAKNLNAKITTGNGTIAITGNCENAEFKVTGTGNIKAANLKAQNVVCRILGGGSISTYPIKTLNTRGVGSTKIFYRGNPVIKRRGGGKLIHID